MRSARTPAWKPENSATLTDLVARRAAAEPDGVYFTLFGTPLTAARLHATSLRYAGALRARGIGPGDKVAIVLPTCEEFFFTFFGALAIGAVPVPLYPTLEPELKARVFRSCEARAVVTIDWFRADVEAARAAAPDLRDLVTPDVLDAGHPVADMVRAGRRRPLLPPVHLRQHLRSSRRRAQPPERDGHRPDDGRGGGGDAR